MFDVLRDYGTILILREHKLPRVFYIPRVHLRTRLPIRRYENRKFDFIDVLKKYTRILNMTHMTLAACMLLSILAAFFGSMTHRKEQTH